MNTLVRLCAIIWAVDLALVAFVYLTVPAAVDVLNTLCHSVDCPGE